MTNRTEARPFKRRIASFLFRLRRRVASFIAPSQRTREQVVAFYLRGSGLEIGALNQPSRVPHDITVSYVDRYSVLELRQQYPELVNCDLVAVDLLDDGRYLTKIPDASQDFVISFHFLEHCDDPIRTLINHFRVLKVGGFAIIGIPDRTNRFDKNRPVTPLEHFYEDFEHGPQHSRAAHFEEHMRLVAGMTDENEIQAEISKNMDSDSHMHFHVWTLLSFLEFLSSLQKRGILNFHVESASIDGQSEIIVALRKTA